MSSKDYGRYALLKKLATGGMAEVFLARQKGLEGFEKMCVIKRILPHLADDAEFVTMFLNEARIAARFGHPNIAQIYDLGKEESTYYIAMEYIHGEDLGRVMRQAWAGGTWMPVPIALRIIAGSCEWLHYAHTKTDERGAPLKVVHRDVSPQNVLVSFEGAAKIVDFGIARAADQVSTTRSGAIKGKFAYMSPEQASGKALDHRSDQFAIALVLYELLTGVRPFKRESDILTLKAAVDCEIPPPSQVAEVPPELDSIVMQALAKVADDRYPDTRGLQLALENFIVQKGWTVTSAHVAEFMRQLFADRLQREEETGEPAVHGLESQTGFPVSASGSFPLPKRMPTRPEFVVAGASGPAPLNPAALAEAAFAEAAPMPAVEPEKPAWRSEVRMKPASGQGVAARRRTAERSAAMRSSSSSIRPVADFDGEAATTARPVEEVEAPRPRRATGQRRAAPAPEPEAPPPRRSTAARRRSVMGMTDEERAELEAQRRESVRPTRARPAPEPEPEEFGDGEEENTRAVAGAEPEEPERRPFPRWPLKLLVAVAVVALALHPAVRRVVVGILTQVSSDEARYANKTALYLESNVPVEVFRGEERLGTTPLDGVLVPEGPLALRLSNTSLGIERPLDLVAQGSTLRHKEPFSLGRVRFRADKECDVFIKGAKVARAPGPPLDFFEGTYDVECRNESLGLIGKSRVAITKDRAKVADVFFKLTPMDR